MCTPTVLTTCLLTTLTLLSTHTAISATTTTSLRPLQPPFNVTSTTTTSVFRQNDSAAVKTDDSWPSDGTKKQQQRKYHVLGPRVPANYQNQLTDFNAKRAEPAKLNDSVRYMNGFVSQTVASNATTSVPTNSHGYIQFEMHTPATTANATAKKQDTVNAVLSSLFPNGFSDIFRFSYAAEPEPVPTTPPSSTTTPIAPTNRTFVSYATSVTREYRRELRPGHTQIVVEKLQRIGAPPTSSEEFRDGNNQISKDELMRINRAAVDASVLPSLLLKPATHSNATNATLQPKSEPIVILNESAPESDEMDEADNQIAESQNIATQFYQTLPYPGSAEHPAEINVHIVHDDTLGNAQGESYQSLQQQHLPAVMEQNYVQEAPSRKFLKSFKPKLSESADRPIPKGNFHYEAMQGRHRGNYGTYYAPPAQQAELPAQLSSKLPNAKLSAARSPDYHGYDVADQTTELPQSVVFVTLGTPIEPGTGNAPIATATPHSYVSEAAVTAPQRKQPQSSSPGYTFVEVQKSINIHNKLITERDGRLVEQHETIYPQEQSHPQQQQQQQQKQYQSLAKNPINVQNSDAEHEPYATAASQAVEHQIEPSAVADSDETQAPATQHVAETEEQQYEQHSGEAVQQPQYTLHVEQEPTVQQAVEYAQQSIEPVTAHEAHEASQVDNHVQIEEQQLFEQHTQSLQLAPTAPAQPYYGPEIVERHIPVPYAVPEPVPVPVHVEHYIDRPYPVETIIEKRIPYPVEKVVEKVVEKQVPVEVERIVEKPVEKVVEKYVDRPVPVPIHVPVAIHIPSHDYAHTGYGHSGFAQSGYGQSGYGYPESVPWAQPGPSIGTIPHKVLRNYYTRMLKKLIPQIDVHKLTPTKAPSSAPKAQTKKANQQPSANAKKQKQKNSYNFDDARNTDLIPPPPPSSASWSQGARYVYNTLPRDLTGVGATAYNTLYERYKSAASVAAAAVDEPYDEFQRWRNGHTLKRSPDFGRNLHMEYGFKPPLVPSLEIDERGMPLQANNDNAKA